ncbi:asparagine-rich protein-like [Mytilus galloprovincialis]|uniref:asparagine-rich protein-like n=1 Tax=Mytilus galloprovincialis TaxID=29158 RepID=UPI003F7BB3D3
MEYLSISTCLVFLFIAICNAQRDALPDLNSLDLFKDHPMDIGTLLPESLLRDSSLPSSLMGRNIQTQPSLMGRDIQTPSPLMGRDIQTPSPLIGRDIQTPSPLIGRDIPTSTVATTETVKFVPLSATKPATKAFFSMRNAEIVNPTQVQANTSKITVSPFPATVAQFPATAPPFPATAPPFPATEIVKSIPTSVAQPPGKSSIITDTMVYKTKLNPSSSDLGLNGRVVHEFLPQNVWRDMKTQSNALSNDFKDGFNVAGSSILVSDVFKQPWNRQNLNGGSFILQNRIKKLKQKKKIRKQIIKNKQPSIEQLTNILKRENTLLNIALGLISKDKSYLKDSLFSRKNNCPYKPHLLNKKFFMEKVKDNGWIKRRCALGTAYDQDTCECSINIGYQPEGCKPEVFMDFNKGAVVDLSSNEIPCGVEGVVSLSDLAYFNGASRIIIWRYTNFDFQHAMTLKFRFKSEAKSRSKPHPLITNCGTGQEEPSFGVILNSFADVLTFFVKTTESEIKFLTFKINPMEWNDVIYSYDGEHLTGKVNGLEKRKSVNGNVEIRSAEMMFGHCERYGYFKGFLDDVKIYNCVPKEI